MLRKKHTLNLTLLILFLCASTNSFCQSYTKDITQNFDKIAGYNNLDISNGVFLPPDYPYILNHQNKYFVNKNKERSVISTNQPFQNAHNNYTKGKVTYNDNHYYDVALQYDIYKDLLIYHPKGASSVACKLIQQKVDSFTIFDKNFIRFNKINRVTNAPNFQGYYQKIEIDKNLKLFIKYSKNRQKKVKNSKMYYFYVPNHKFWINYREIFTEISSKNDVVRTFPTLSKEIKNFYKAKEYLKDSNLPLFYENLMFYIKDLLNN